MPHRRFQTPRIVQASGHRHLVLPILVLMLLAVVAWAGFEYGKRAAGYFSARSETERARLERRLTDLKGECEEQRELAARYARASQIDRLAAGQVREELKKLQEERSELRKKVAFLNTLILGKVLTLQVSEIELVKQDKAGAYRFSFLISKRAKGNDKTSGKVELQVVGQLQGKPVTLKNDQLGLDKPLKMGFKHFQKFEGHLQLPAGFVPEELVVIGRPEGKKYKPFEQRHKWEKS